MSQKKHHVGFKLALHKLIEENIKSAQLTAQCFVLLVFEYWHFSIFSGRWKVFSSEQIKYPQIFISGLIFLAYKIFNFGVKVALKSLTFYSVRKEFKNS